MSDGLFSRPNRTPSPGPRDGCPCEFCEVSRIVLAMVRDRVPPGFVWGIAPARNPSDETRAFVVRWGDA